MQIADDIMRVKRETGAARSEKKDSVQHNSASEMMRSFTDQTTAFSLKSRGNKLAKLSPLD